MKAGHIIQKLL